MIKAVIFDLDGVIVDSEIAHALAEKKVLAAYGLVIDEGDWNGFKGKKLNVMMQEIIDKYRIKDVSLEQLIADKQKYNFEVIDQSVLFTDFQELIGSIQSDYAIGLATSSTALFQAAIFDKFNLHSYFRAVVNAEMVSHGKPHPEPYQLAMRKLGVEPLEVVIIEDAPAGIESGKAAGAKVVAVTHSLPSSYLRSADYVVDSLLEVKDILKRLAK